MMRERLWTSLKISLEWRAIAFVITNIFFWVTSGELWKATLLAFTLQFILLIVHFIWYFYREKHYYKKGAL